MSDILIRKAGADELHRIADLKRQIHQLHVDGRPDLFAPMQDDDVYQAHAQEKGMHLFLAEKGDAVVGYALITYVHRPAGPYMCERKFMHVEEFCVDENCHRQGVGRMLMEALRQDAAESGYPRLELDVWAFNEGARKFYESIGFTTYRYFMETNA